ncbi:MULTISPECIES: phosphate acyltransferase PlsX [Mammaliicoccus]|uniref:Phosphate acyltransferase n=1 Tax=Mammaliicoccus fleurettii TaxID=150056 RepID=A0ABS5MJ74_9STAP|nr:MULTISPECIES: phosphate acyltransferase PlsX [Mammaliicoccus]HCN60601.1 phosphate acyltransferase PlsX [Staphylococcus sp.]MBL0846915.1 phosphate acyltransferase PlsX [Mammaliicoccus fleurettii]MBO3062851.1 phosphate acyltransferase PlsX [Mammaliicoccus fleurettii]MBS3670878.1 phosphate acyltransferase PlsX [Mammaliicoccus fleurettii]MBS3695937.1 phosphate acyltransferase PlsX [Mammaliicoccus fleurettii]
MVKIAIDMMGGDEAPGIVIESVKTAIHDFPDLEILLYGDEKQYNYQHERITFQHTDEVITMDDEPVRSIKKKKNSSMVLMANAVKEGKAEACVSAGNTGALMSSGLFIVGRIKGIERPALVATFPTVTGKGFVFLDIGANSDAKPEHLVQYAKMGEIYAKQVRKIDNPSLALLNIGTEESKGNAVTKKTYQLLKEEKFDNFIGNVESKSLLLDACDVVVSDGYNGNLVLKTIEGTATGIFKMLKEAMTASTKNKLAALTLKKDFKKINDKMDYAEYGGSVLLGLNGIVVKAHGSSNERAFYNAIKQAKLAADTKIVDKMKKAVGEINE